MKKILSILIILFVSCSLFSCSDVIEIDVKDGVSQLTVDALVNNKKETQTTLFEK